MKPSALWFTLERRKRGSTTPPPAGQQDEFGLRHFLYSMHCSPRELRVFLQLLVRSERTTIFPVDYRRSEVGGTSCPEAVIFSWFDGAAGPQAARKPMQIYHIGPLAGYRSAAIVCPESEESDGESVDL